MRLIKRILMITFDILQSWKFVMKLLYTMVNYNLLLHTYDDVIKWKHFSRHWSFVRGIRRSPVNSPHKGQWRGALMFSLFCVLNKRLSKQSRGWWFKTPSRSLWHHCDFMKALHEVTSMPRSCHDGDNIGLAQIQVLSKIMKKMITGPTCKLLSSFTVISDVNRSFNSK